MTKLLLALALILGLPAVAWAHVQGGPPYLQVNGDYADTTPIISSGQITVPQDISKKNILVGTEVDFKVDLSRLTVPITIAQSSKWRWKFSLTDANFVEGVEVHHRYDQTGSYLITLQVKDPTSPNFIDYDLVQVNITPKLDYVLPTATVSAVISRDSGLQDVTFSVQGAADPSTSLGGFSWDFGDGTQGSGDSVLHSYAKSSSAYYPLLRVTDSNGIFNDYVTEVTGDDRVSSMGSSYLATPSGKPLSSSGLPWAALLAGLVALVTAVFAVFKLSRR